MLVTEIKKDEDIYLRLNELAIESDSEFKNVQVDRSLAVADKGSNGGFKPKIKDENQKDLHEDASHSRYDIKEDEDIILLMNGLAMDSVRESVNAADKFKKEQNDLHRELNVHQSLADEESDGGFKYKIEENAEDLHKYPSNSQYDNKKVQINENLKESNSVQRITESPEVKTKVDPFDDSASSTLEELEEIVLKFHEFIDHTFPMLKDAQKEKLKVEDRFDFLEKIRYLLLTTSQRVDTVIQKVERLKNDENQEENCSRRKTQIPEIVYQLVEINAILIERSFHQGIAFLLDDDCTEKKWSSCVDEFNRSREILGINLLRIRELKNEKIEDGDATKEREDCFNASDCAVLLT